MPEGFERINVAPAYQLVAEAIEREIVSGRIQPGDQIGTEAETWMRRHVVDWRTRTESTRPQGKTTRTWRRDLAGTFQPRAARP